MPKNYDGFAHVVGFGKRPAIVVVDFIYGFTDVASPLASNYDEQLVHSTILLQSARNHRIPIFFTTVSYKDVQQEATFFVQKIPALAMLKDGSRWVEQDERLQRMVDEPIIIKKFASAFFETNLHALLQNVKADTIIVIGCTTSGCIRATVVDALQHGYRVIVPEECVGDRSLAQHQANLFDIHNKYGDVVTKDLVIRYFKQLKEEKLDV